MNNRTKISKHCTECGSTNILADAFARWNESGQYWEIDNVFDDFYCEDCDGEAGVEDREKTSEPLTPNP